MDDPAEWTAEDVLRLAHQWLVLDPPQVVELSGGRQVGRGLVSTIEHRVAQLRRMDDFMAGGELYAVVAREVEVTAGVVRDARYSEAVGRRLLGAVGELCQLAGWIHDDAGQHGRAAHYYAVGVGAAHAAGAVPLGANLISTLSYQVSNVGDPREAVLLAKTAARGAEKTATPRARALFTERVAYAHARAGERQEAERALAEVERLYARDADEPEWVYWLTEGEIDIMAGRCLVELGLPDRAVPLLENALRDYPVELTRETALYTSWLAEAHLRAGDIDTGVSHADRVLDLTRTTASTRGRDRAMVLIRLLEPHRNVGIVRDFLERTRV
ncbi:tetratricopeptide repeat protein [Actinokineospora enzanensis]|uniref:tetratricopeptide repeat protein n=1 Tax=Actinokineospora enzanensis TaxID=155975 RepID=UPI0003758A17|nr:hypothetical protein [Actinokineospora enzanensis]